MCGWARLMTTRCQRDDCPPPATVQEVVEASILGDLEDWQPTGLALDAQAIAPDAEIRVPEGGVPVTYEGQRVGTATFDVPEGGGVVYIQGDNGAWRQIGTAEPSQFAEVSGDPAYPRRDMEWSPGQVLANGDSMSFTVTFEFDPATVDSDSFRALYGVDGSATYLEETPDGDIVERIDRTLQAWEHRHDAMHWTPNPEGQPAPVSDADANLMGIVQDRLWAAMGAYDADHHAMGLSQGQRPTVEVGHHLAAALRYIRASYDAIDGARPHYGWTRITEETRARAARALEEWISRGGSVAQWRPRWLRHDEEE